MRQRPLNVATPDLSWQAVALGAARDTSESMQDLLALPSPRSMPLSMGYLPPDLQATELLSTALKQVAKQPALWDRLPLEGMEPLRSWFAREIGQGNIFTPHEVIICPGGQAAIASTLRALLAPGSTLLVEAPTYIGVISAARAAGITLVPVPTDGDGVRPDLLEATLRETGARVFYCQPTFANPSGTLLSQKRRNDVLGVISDARAFLIEDDWARDLYLGTPPPAPLAAQDSDGHVIYIRSLAKSAAPGLRIAAIMARGAALARLRATRGGEDFFVSGPLQAVALNIVTSSGWKRHLNNARNALTERRDTLMAALRSELGHDIRINAPQGGMHLWVQLEDHVSDVAIASDLARQGVLVSPGKVWFPADPPGSYLRLTFAAAPSILREGARIIATTLKQKSGPQSG
ncbi:PLP-dependent aminotransferase family protein [Phyllobacterium sp. OV277]|uniref:aminotransferase-like domain-containing protein n=1 Tax=Phyllobacterium sp. OV277 TaxID=1882772 RepID=UPI0008828500|nr:PLP-dependent aminotransferase family protein [Phyllobacterium sp. OV277]SDO11715.1 DNA-binding transcriptional regulator, MocR family, contains an aminotransferase domain [Phyllobacterium sp. OV277]